MIHVIFQNITRWFIIIRWKILPFLSDKVKENLYFKGLTATSGLIDAMLHAAIYTFSLSLKYRFVSSKHVKEIYFWILRGTRYISSLICSRKRNIVLHARFRHREFIEIESVLQNFLDFFLLKWKFIASMRLKIAS